MNYKDTFDHTILKKKKCCSVKKPYNSDFPFYDEKKIPKFFKFFKDDDIGITKEWRTELITQVLFYILFRI